jgi:putative oxidoreductase
MASVAASSPATSAARSKALHVALWVVQVLLAAAFAMAGFLKTTTPIADLAKEMSVPRVLGEGMTRFIGVSELAAAVGLVLPALTRIRPMLTPLAAAALVVVMVLAAGYHVIQGEYQGLPVVAVLGGLAAFVAWGRFRAAPIDAKS